MKKSILLFLLAGLSVFGQQTVTGVKLKIGTGASTIGGPLSTTSQILSTLATGTAPFVVASTTAVANLNASLLGGATFAAPGAIGGGAPNTGAFTTLTSTGASSFATASGSVGVGTASPGAILHVTGVGPATWSSTAWRPTVEFNIAGANSAMFVLSQGTAADPSFGFAIDPTTDGLWLYKNTRNDITGTASVMMAFDDSGNVLIGSTTDTTGRLQVTSTGQQLRLAYNGSNYMTAEVGSTGGVTFDAVGAGAGFGFNDFISTTALFYTPSGVSNSTAANNAYYQTPTTGPLITRNVADANPALIVQQVHASSTGDIAQFKNDSATVASISRTGIISGSGAAPTIASAGTIAPTTRILFVSGITTVSTITAPEPIATGGGQITILPTGVFLTDALGNIALASTTIVGKALTMTYDPGTTKWYPSY